MTSTSNNILKRLQRKWQALLWLDILLLSLSASVLVFLWSSNMIYTVIALVVSLIVASVFIKPWAIDLFDVSRLLDQKLESFEYSTSLFLKPENELSDIAKLQRLRITEQIKNEKKIIPPTHLKQVSLSALIMLVIGVIGYQTNIKDYFKTTVSPESQNQIIQFQSPDTTVSKLTAPKLISNQLSIRYPSYTRVGTVTTSNMNIRALEGSKVFWSLQFDAEVDSVGLQSMGTFKPMSMNNGEFGGSSTLTASGFYNFKFSDLSGADYSSDLYTIEVIKDASPKVEISGVNQFTSFNYFDDKRIQFTTRITDDYGINDAYIIATVSKGSGESVKFREVRLSFNQTVKSGSKNLNLSRSIDLDDMNMEPGDELYFYVETMDQKPTPNITRSETMFAVIKDTTSYVFSTEGTLGVDRMPDYFRSQRQLIIDTEKLIKDKPNLSEQEFKFKSNELGFDQKSLRLKYAEFMGEEVDSGLDIDTEEPIAEEEDHDGEHEDEDPLAEYTHDHDNENEHNLVDHDHEDEEDEDSSNPLSKYIHDHSDPESATLFEESLKTKLRKALNEMWDAELYLRLYTPEKSLPYQYRALNLIQEIKNSARIYVHRIGFDPPPIKEDKRLTGKLEEVKSFRKNLSIDPENNYKAMVQSIATIEYLIQNEMTVTKENKLLFEQCGNELASIAIKFPGKHLKTLQDLRLLTDGINVNVELLRSVQNGLIQALPSPKENPGKTDITADEINQMLLKELTINDR